MLKIKNQKSTFQSLKTLAEEAGLILMSAAAVFSMLDLPEHFTNRVTVPTHSSLAWVTPTAQFNNTLRRERDETDQHYVAYSIAQRTPGRASRY